VKECYHCILASENPYFGPMKIAFNAPVVLVFTLAAFVVHLLSISIWPGFNTHYFATSGYFHWNSVGDYFRIFSHILGHQDWNHLLGNFTLVLLMGPILEEKFGSKKLLVMILFTAFATGAIYTMFWDTGIMGASGIVFMMILLGSMVNFKSGTIPITFILVAVLFLGREIYESFVIKNNVANFAHILGGICGVIFGFFLGKTGKSAPLK
jgi:membrane associated rhomboid family serine protease